MSRLARLFYGKNYPLMGSTGPVDFNRPFVFHELKFEAQDIKVNSALLNK